MPRGKRIAKPAEWDDPQPVVLFSRPIDEGERPSSPARTQRTFPARQPARARQRSEYVLVTNQRNFIKHSFFWRHVQAVFGNGLLTSEGDFWLREQRLCQPAFHREQVAAYGAVMVDFTERDVAEWRNGEVRDVHQDPAAVPLRAGTSSFPRHAPRVVTVCGA